MLACKDLAELTWVTSCLLGCCHSGVVPAYDMPSYGGTFCTYSELRCSPTAFILGRQSLLDVIPGPQQPFTHNRSALYSIKPLCLLSRVSRLVSCGDHGSLAALSKLFVPDEVSLNLV